MLCLTSKLTPDSKTNIKTNFVRIEEKINNILVPYFLFYLYKKMIEYKVILALE